jgi:hypothetical protein
MALASEETLSRSGKDCAKVELAHCCAFRLLHLLTNRLWLIATNLTVA